MNDPTAATSHQHGARTRTGTGTGTGTGTEELLPIELGDMVVLTEGQGGGSSEDKRRAYNC